MQVALPLQSVKQLLHNYVPAGQADIHDAFCKDQDYQPQPALQAAPPMHQYLN